MRPSSTLQASVRPRRAALTAVAAAAMLALGAGAALAAGGGGGGMGEAPSTSGPSYDPAVEYARGVTALQAGQNREAARALRKVTDAVPSSVEAWRLLGAAYAGDQDWKGARRAFERAVKLTPDDYVAHAGLGMALAHLKDPKAQAQLDWLKARSQACGAGCADAEPVRSASSQLEAAMAEAAGAAGAVRPGARLETPLIFAAAKGGGQGSGQLGDLAYDRAVSLINAHRYDDALAALSQAAAVFGPHPDILTYQGYTWRKKGDYDRAETYYRRALAIAPAHRGATEYYGELKVERGDLQGARRMLARLDAVCAYGCAEAEALRQWVDLGRDPQRP
jgi:Flp pilus assembly protein TadD